jgi:hypothetical protein
MPRRAAIAAAGLAPLRDDLAAIAAIARPGDVVPALAKLAPRRRRPARRIAEVDTDDQRG